MGKRISAAAFALLVVILLAGPWWSPRSVAPLHAAGRRSPTALPALAHRPQFPDDDRASAAAWQPAFVRFADVSTLAMVPDRVRVAWGRPVTIHVERFDAAGAPMSGVLDMEIVVDTPGQPPFKLGPTESATEPGQYECMIDGATLGIGRTD